jgi:hypothetical protein
MGGGVVREKEEEELQEEDVLREEEVVVVEEGLREGGWAVQRQGVNGSSVDRTLTVSVTSS